MPNDIPKADDVVEVTPITTPTKHNGTLRPIGESFEAEFGHVKGLIERGVLGLEGLVDSKPVKVRADELIKQIQDANSAEGLKSLAEGDDRATVKAAYAKRLAELQPE